MSNIIGLGLDATDIGRISDTIERYGERFLKRIFTEGRIYPRGFEWLPDSSGFYTWAPYSTHPKFLTATIEKMYFYPLASGKSFEVPLDWENGINMLSLASVPSTATELKPIDILSVYSDEPDWLLDDD